MKKFGISSLLALSFLIVQNTFATEVKNLKITANDDYVNILWEALPNETLDKADGYAIQWSDRQANVKIDTPANLYLLRTTGQSLSRNSFDNNKNYYLRVYTYAKNGTRIRDRALGNGSQMLKWKVDYNNEVTSENIAVNDPVISTSTTSSSDEIDKIYEFGKIRVIKYDSFADFSWSRANLAKSEFDGNMVVISKNSDLSSPIVEATVERDQYNLRVKGLDPDTQYYARGYFYKEEGGENKKFGSGEQNNFRTIKEIARNASSRAARNITKIEKQAKRSFTVGGATSSSTTSTTSSSSTVSKTVSSKNLTNKSDIRRRIAEIKSQIRSLESEMRKLEAKIGTSSSRKVSTQKKSSTKQLSLRERLRLKLASKRNS